MKGKENKNYLYKQPTELVSPHKLALMSYQEKDMYAVKLKAEIKEYELRETFYANKRRDLLEIEEAFRKR